MTQGVVLVPGSTIVPATMTVQFSHLPVEVGYEKGFIARASLENYYGKPRKVSSIEANWW